MKLILLVLLVGLICFGAIDALSTEQPFDEREAGKQGIKVAWINMLMIALLCIAVPALFLSVVALRMWIVEKRDLKIMRSMKRNINAF